MNNVRTDIKNHKGYVYIPDLRSYKGTEVKRIENLVNSETLDPLSMVSELTPSSK